MSSQKRKTAARSALRPTSRKVANRKKTTAKLSEARGQNNVLALRQGFGLSRKVFSRLSHFSERAIAEWEGGESLGGASRQRMTELERLQQGLATVIEPDYIGEWLQTPNDSFDGLKPLEVIERGQVDRVWRMIYLLESGVPS
jgi:DNA-binding transcriptional regulator YiaG